MEKTYGLIELSETELTEITGGAFPMLIIRLFIPSPGGILSFIDGLSDGYKRTTQ
jgi:bacteriocin-like protein